MKIQVYMISLMYMLIISMCFTEIIRLVKLIYADLGTFPMQQNDKIIG